MSLTTFIFDKYQEFIQSGDPRISHWPLVASPVPTVVMTLLYLSFVKIWGPKWMKDRPAFDLRGLMIVYNLALVMISTVLFYRIGRSTQWGLYCFSCHSVDTSTDKIPMEMCRLGYYFLLTKYLEFADTIIFVLRKKGNQITTLHVFHHTAVPVTVWYGFKFAPGGNNALFPFLNTGIHALMYLYYGLSAFGPHMQKYLWWKRYLTKLQLIQFVCLIIQGCAMLFQDCNFPRFFLFLNVFYGTIFFFMFSSFYQKRYIKKSEDQKLLEKNRVSTRESFMNFGRSIQDGIKVNIQSFRKSFQFRYLFR